MSSMIIFIQLKSAHASLQNHFTKNPKEKLKSTLYIGNTLVEASSFFCYCGLAGRGSPEPLH